MPHILPEEVIDKYGADTLRYYMIGGTPPGVDINYNFDDMKIKHRNLGILWNLTNFVIDIAKTNDQDYIALSRSKLRFLIPIT